MPHWCSSAAAPRSNRHIASAALNRDDTEQLCGETGNTIVPLNSRSRRSVGLQLTMAATIDNLADLVRIVGEHK